MDFVHVELWLSWVKVNYLKGTLCEKKAMRRLRGIAVIGKINRTRM